MSIHNAPLRKLLKFFYMSESELQSGTRKDIREHITKLKAKKAPAAKRKGGDFYSEFWADAKQHMLGNIEDLNEATTTRVFKSEHSQKNKGDLYPKLAAGFLKWWDNKRRWSNEKIKLVDVTPSVVIDFAELGTSVKLENLLAIQIGDQSHKLIYPYFNKEFTLSNESARQGLWLLGEAFPEYGIQDMRLLDVFQGNSVTVNDVPLQGNEERLFIANYRRILKKWDDLSKEYAWPK